MRILLVNYMETTAPGGINKTVREIAENLSENGHEVIVLQSNPYNLPSKELIDNFKIIRIKSRIEKYSYGLNLSIYSFLKNNFKKLNPDIVHIHGYHTLFSQEVIFIIRKINPDIPIVFSPHFGIFSRNTIAGKYLGDLYNFIGRRFLKYVDLVFASSIFESDNINKILNVPVENIKVLRHGIDCIDLKKEVYDENVINLIYVGYLLELKGIQYIFKSLHELVYNKNVKANLTIIGEGPYEEILRKLAVKLDLMDFITWKGFIHLDKQDELFKYYKKSDILLLLSQSENYGIVVAESLGMGTPAIVTKRTALKEFLDEEGCFGVEYPPNPIEVAKVVIEISKNNINVDSLSSKIRTWDEVAEDYELIYKRLINE